MKVKPIIDDLIKKARGVTLESVVEVVVTGGLSKMNVFRLLIETIFPKDIIEFLEDGVIRGMAHVCYSDKFA